MSLTIIKIDDFIQANNLRLKINGAILNDLRLEHNGEVISIDAKNVEFWKETGLNNWDFLCCYLRELLKGYDVSSM